MPLHWKYSGDFIGKRYLKEKLLLNWKQPKCNQIAIIFTRVKVLPHDGNFSDFLIVIIVTTYYVTSSSLIMSNHGSGTYTFKDKSI